MISGEGIAASNWCEASPDLKRETPHPKLLRSFDLSRGRGDASERLPQITRDEILRATRAWIGTPYLHQASAKGQGADCLGLIRGVWRGVYGEEPEAPPPYTPDWNERAAARGGEPLVEAARRNAHEIPHDARRPGDILVFRIVRGGPAKHCGILSAGDRFIHAYAGRCVLESWLSRWWTERLAGVFIFPGAE